MKRDILIRLLITLLLLASLIPAARLTAHAAPLPDATAPDGTLWRWLGGGDISDVFFLGDGRHGWAATTQGFLLRTEDGGARWQYVPNVPVSKIYFVSANRGYGTGSSSGGTWLTTDGGLSWTAQQTGASGSDIQFVSPTEGWVAAGSAVYRTTDGGASWTPHGIISGTVDALSFVDNLHGWGLGNNRVLRTTDGGQSWTVAATVTSPDWYDGLALYDIAFSDLTNGWVVGSAHYPSDEECPGGFTPIMFRSKDGGESWQYGIFGQQTNNSINSPQEIQQCGGIDYSAFTSIYVHGKQGWTKIEGLYDNWSTDCYNDANEWLVTTDGGETWQWKYNEPAPARVHLPEWVGTGYHGAGADFFLPLHDVALGSPERSIVSVDNSFGYCLPGPVYWSHDTGHTFEMMYIGCSLSSSVSDVAFSNADNAWAVVHCGWVLGVVRHSGDGGRSWSYSVIDWFDGRYRYIVMVGALHGWIVGDRGYIQATVDGGHTWVEQTSGVTNTLHSISAVDAQHAWVLMRDQDWKPSATLLHTADGGQTWITQTANAPMNAIKFVSPTLGWGVGSGGAIQHTSDGGQTWQFQDSGTTVTLNDLDFVDARNGWVVGNNGTILRTRDGGVMWYKEPSGTTADLTRIDMADAYNGWVIGNGGLILGRHLIPPPAATPTPTSTATDMPIPTPTETPTVTPTAMPPVPRHYLPLALK